MNRPGKNRFSRPAFSPEKNNGPGIGGLFHRLDGPLHCLVSALKKNFRLKPFYILFEQRNFVLQSSHFSEPAC
jgi:hypothetical protein